VSRGGNKSAVFGWHRQFRTILEQDTSFFRIEEGVLPSTYSAQPKVLDGMCVGRFLARAVSFMKPKKLALAIVKRNQAGKICAKGNHGISPTRRGEPILAELLLP
jgi:hypothetical protein